MTEDQKRIIDGANEKMRPAMELYEGRRKLFLMACSVPGTELGRVCRVLEVLTPDEVSDLLAYAEGLAAWRLPAQESGDAPIAPPDTAASSANGGVSGRRVG